MIQVLVLVTDNNYGYFRFIFALSAVVFEGKPKYATEKREIATNSIFVYVDSH